MAQLGYAHWKGVGTSVNYAAAQDLLRRSFESREISWKALPARWLGDLHNDGKNPRRNPREVTFYYTVAGMLGDARAYLELVYLKGGYSLNFRLRHLMNAIALRDSSQIDTIAKLIDFYKNEETLRLFLDHAGIASKGSSLAREQITPKLKVWMSLGVNGGTAHDPQVLKKAEQLPEPGSRDEAAIREALYLSQAVAGTREAMQRYFEEVRARVRIEDANRSPFDMDGKKTSQAEIPLARLWAARAAALGYVRAYRDAAEAFQYQVGDEVFQSIEGARLMLDWVRSPYHGRRKAYLAARELERTPDLGEERFRLAARWYQYSLLITKDPAAAYHLARIYENGHLGSHPEKIERLYDIASLSEDKAILRSVGTIFAEGNKFVAPDREKAFCAFSHARDFDGLDRYRLADRNMAREELVARYERCPKSAEYAFVVEDYQQNRF